jgi:hypothetical protein
MENVKRNDSPTIRGTVYWWGDMTCCEVICPLRIWPLWFKLNTAQFLPSILSYLEVKIKLKLYKTLIWPVLSYGCEAWTVTQSSEERLAISERKILTRILGPVYKDDLGWRLRHNKELFELLHGPDIVKFIKFKRLQWAGHVVRMDNSRIPNKVLDGKFHVGRPWLRWEDNIRRDSLLLLNIRRWSRWAGDRDIWRQTIEEARTQCGLSRNWRS